MFKLKNEKKQRKQRKQRKQKNKENKKKLYEYFTHLQPVHLQVVAVLMSQLKSRQTDLPAISAA